MFTTRPYGRFLSFALRWRLLACCALALALSGTAGCVQKMDDQPILEPLEASDFFSDGQASRDWIAGTVARGNDPNQITSFSEHYTTGLTGNEPATTLPPQLEEQYTMRQLLARGQERYDIFCSHCHDLQGSGQGIVPQRGFTQPPTFHSNRLRAVSLGHIYRVIAYGKGRMPAHAGQIPPADRWAIAAYVRALQLSQHAEAALLQPGELEQLESGSAPPVTSSSPTESPQS